MLLIYWTPLAMLRLPTRLSHGKANLHQGAIGVGVSIEDGTTLCGTWRDTCIAEHPDTGFAIAGLTIPHWDKILHTSARCYDMSQLGYLGVDLVLDKQLGPLMLELNARPGLSIQIANQEGLLPRLQRIASLADPKHDVQERVAIAQRTMTADGHNKL